MIHFIQEPARCRIVCVSYFAFFFVPQRPLPSCRSEQPPRQDRAAGRGGERAAEAHLAVEELLAAGAVAAQAAAAGISGGLQ